MNIAVGIIVHIIAFLNGTVCFLHFFKAKLQIKIDQIVNTILTVVFIKIMSLGINTCISIFTTSGFYINCARLIFDNFTLSS